MKKLVPLVLGCLTPADTAAVTLINALDGQPQEASQIHSLNITNDGGMYVVRHTKATQPEQASSLNTAPDTPLSIRAILDTLSQNRYITPQTLNEEVEIKVQLDETQSELLVAWLATHAEKTGTSNQVDTYFQHPTVLADVTNTKGFIDAEGFLRIRNEDGDYSICYKGAGSSLERRVELEIAIESGATMRTLLETLGFSERVSVSKTREKYIVAYEDALLEVALDSNVMGQEPDKQRATLGDFTEIEIKSGNKNPAVLYNFLRAVGIDSVQLSTKSYYHRALNPTYNFSITKSLTVE